MYRKQTRHAVRMYPPGLGHMEIQVFQNSHNFNKGELHMSAHIQLKVHDCSELFSSYFSMVPSPRRTACNINALGFVSTQHTLHPQ